MKSKGLFLKQHRPLAQRLSEQPLLLWQPEKMFPELLPGDLFFSGERSGRKENAHSSSSITCSSVGVLAAPACPLQCVSWGCCFSAPKHSGFISPARCRAVAMQDLAQKGLQGCGTWAKHCLHSAGSLWHLAGSSALKQACSQKSPTGALTGSERGNQWDDDGLQPPWV